MLQSPRGKSPHVQPSMPEVITHTEGRMVLQPVLKVE